MYGSIFIAVAIILLLIIGITVPLVITSPAVETSEPISPSLSSFAIALTFSSGVSESVQSIFEQAASSWQDVIVESHPSSVTLTGTLCGYTFPGPTTVEDIQIFIQIIPIDGVGGILGSAGPCAVDELYMPRFGLIRLDSADVNGMMIQGTLLNVVRHEIGHVLGIGTLWYSGYTYIVQTGGYPYLLPHGNSADLLVGHQGGAIVEDLGGSGTRGGHWKEEVYDSELMTGYVEQAGISMPLSVLTIGALKDLGYSVNENAAEPYTVSINTRRRLRSKVKLVSCTYGIPPVRHVNTDAKRGFEDIWAKKLNAYNINP